MKNLKLTILIIIFLSNIQSANANFGTVYNPSSSNVLSGRDNSLRGAKQNPQMQKNTFNYNKTNASTQKTPPADSTSGKNRYYSNCQFGVCTPGGNRNIR